MTKKQFDAVIIGAGVGGCSTAALLSHAGFKCLLIEKKPYLGGRFSTIERKGFKCSTGGVAVEVGGPIEKVCEQIGIDPEIRPSKKAANWIAGEYHEFPEQGGGLRTIIRDVADNPDEANRVLAAMNHAFTWSEPTDHIDFRTWLNQYTSNEKIHGIFQATISSLLTVNANELSAKEYFLLIKTIAPLRFGYIANGSISLWNKMGELVKQTGGEVWTSCSISEILSDRGKVNGVHVRKNRKDIFIDTKVVVSNLAPDVTAELVGHDKIELSYLKQIEDTVTPTNIIWIHFESNEQLLDYSAIATSCTRRVNMVDMPTMECPELAPEGKHLYIAGAAPLNSLHPENIEQDVEASIDDLRDIIPNFDKHCRILSKSKFRGKNPGFRTMPGKPFSIRTPIENLYNTGDAACPRGYAGSMGAAKSAQLTLEDVTERSNLKMI